MKSSGFDPITLDVFSKRFRYITLVMIAILAVLILRLWFLQVIYGHIYRTKSEKNRIQLESIPPFRGMIFDRNGELLVDNHPSYNLYVIPEEIKNPDHIITSLHYLIDLPEDQLQKRMEHLRLRQPFKPLLIKKNISREDLAVIETNLFNLPGVRIQVSPQRYYIYGDFASHLIGYLGEINERQLLSKEYPHAKPGDLIGKYGVEGNWQDYLTGVSGGRQVEVDAAGRKLRVISKKQPVPGLNIGLTIDRQLQALADKSLSGKKGAIVAMNPNTGEILAMASSPAFDPNLFIKGMDQPLWKQLVSSKDYPLQNRAISGQYPPGSTFKIVIALAALEEGIITPEEEIFCPGHYRVGNHDYRCWRKQGHGKVNLHRALVESCDTYFYKLGRQLGVDRIHAYARMCGLGMKTGIDLPYEKPGLIPSSRWKLKRFGVPWQPGETVSLAIGQSYALVTPLQMASMMSAIFNGGKIYKPKIVNWVGKGERGGEFVPTQVGRIKYSEENIDLIRKGLIGVVNEPRGTGKMARHPDVVVAGKTGTAQVIALEAEKVLDQDKGIPVHFKDHAWFIAIAPADKPRLVLAIVIENGGHGGSSAAPIAGEMFKLFFGEGENQAKQNKQEVRGSITAPGPKGSG